MFNIVRFTRPAFPALALVLTLSACDNGTNTALTSLITGGSTTEHQQLHAQLQQTKEALAQMDQEIRQAESHDARGKGYGHPALQASGLRTPVL